MLKMNKFIWRVVWTCLKAKVFIAVTNMIILQMGITAHTFGQSPFKGSFHLALVWKHKIRSSCVKNVKRELEEIVWCRGSSCRFFLTTLICCMQLNKIIHCGLTKCLWSFTDQQLGLVANSKSCSHGDIASFTHYCTSEKNPLGSWMYLWLCSELKRFSMWTTIFLELLNCCCFPFLQF